MISDNTVVAVKALPYPNDMVSNSEYSALLSAYNEAKREIIADFQQRLAEEYASDLPKPVQDKIWSKSYNAPGRSYFHVEIEYISNTEFARFAREAK